MSVTTGPATSDVKVANTVNSNEAVVDCQTCPADVKVEISGNGADSKKDDPANTVNLNLSKLDFKIKDEELIGVLALVKEFQDAINSESLTEEIISDEEDESIVYDKFKQGSNPNPIYNQGRVLDYEETFSHLGQMQTKSMYEGMTNFGKGSSSSKDDDSGKLTEEDNKKWVFHEKYETGNDVSGITGIVPKAGYTSEKWEVLKIQAILDPGKMQLYRNLN